MVGVGRTLRVSILGVKVQEARRYHISLQVLAPGQAPVGVIGLNDAPFDAIRPDQVARTETCAMSRNPEFLNRVFVMRLPEPLGNSLTPQVLLQCNLFATPTMEGPPGPMVAGREVDELVGAATLQIGGDVAARLLRGERVTLPVVLGAGDTPFVADTRSHNNNLDLLSSLGVNSNAAMFGRTGREVLLELMLVDAEVSLPRDVYAVKASYAGGKSMWHAAGTGTAGQKSNSGAWGSHVPSLDRGPVECRLLVLVSRAENLPPVRGDNGSDTLPNTFVAVKSQRDTINGLPPQGVTRVVEQTTSPVWGQLLQVKYAEGELPKEKLMIAIVNDDNSRLLLKCAVPLAHIVPNVHYNLKLIMPGGPLGSNVTLHISLCLVDSPRSELRRVKQLAGSSVRNVIQTRLAALSKPLHELMLGAAQPAQAPAPGSEVFAIWKLGPGAADAASTAPSAISADSLYIPIDTASEDECSRALQRLSEAYTAQSAATTQAGETGTLGMLPLHIWQGESGAESLAWPPDHMAMLLGQIGATSTLSMELHQLSTGAKDSTPLAWLQVPGDKLSNSSGEAVILEGLPLNSLQPQGATASVEVAVWDSNNYQT
eukprot:CAMPEP_0202919350 /NCGR_PEP_ID=MMETSP1392-20130828/75650_1 /ASSEMBLY_ACC=CAM_ASM_000868 /TAXON_ID=225041 /ORGANISM="Chlamydomonas chlamydogama, Strain SAG 11-48b" /LENGTH=598 /DNA_ID=CAMNT_0049612687 /DNA_START=111 /DNA_END=1904 /DNA_ORIENTATION=-